jgi:uncharacterized protein YdgA (DUF945 family)
MRKLLSGLMILTLVVLFTATYYNSKNTEAVFRAQLAQLDQNYAGLIQVELLDYQRGLLVSEAETRITVRENSLPLQHQFRHFPWKVRLQTGLAQDSDAAAEFAALAPLDKLQVQTDVELNGASKSTLVLPALTISDDGKRLQIKGLQLSFDLEREMTGGDVRLQLASLHLEQPEEASLLLTGVEMNSRFAAQQGLLLGGGFLTVGRLAITPESKPGLELNELRYETATMLEGDQLMSDLGVQLKELSLAGETFTDGQLRLKVSGIDAAALRELQDAAKQMQVELLDRQVDPVVLQLQLLDLYSQLFKDGLTLTLDQLSLQAGDGAIQGQGQLELQELNFIGSPIAADKMTGQFRIDIDKAAFIAGFRLLDKLQRRGKSTNRAVVAEQAEQLAGGLVQKGIFSRRDNGGYRLDMTLEQGQGTLNGKPFSF